MNSISVNNKDYRIIKLLGKGKGGYSYLAECGEKHVAVKQIHHEPCEYYTFGNKIEAERNDYQRLLNAGIRIPEMFYIDIGNERIVKEYIDGETIFDLVKNGESVAVDYFPTNFVVQKQNGLLYYIDYECNNYMDEWSFENWGIKYWSRTPEFEAYLKQH